MKATTTTLQNDQIHGFGFGILITVIILLSALINPLSAQTKLGVRGGLNISEPGLNTGIGNTSDFTKAFTGIDLAVISEFKLSNKWAIQAEMGYTEKGIRLGTGTNINILGTSVPLGVMTTTKIRQIELPVMAKYELSNGAIRTYATAGPTLGYALSGNFKTQGTLLADIDLVNQNLNLGNQNRFSLGLVGGVGLEIEKGPGTLFVDARYQYQALKINNLPIDNVQFNNKGVAFNIGYKFSL